MGAVINSIGIYIPELKVGNKFFETLLDTSDEWIKCRTGIEQRYFAGEKEYTSDMCIKAAQDLSVRYGKNLEDVDFIIVSTMTPDQVVPNVASRVQSALGIRSAGVVDISSACSGFCYAVILAQGLISSGLCRKVLVFGADTMSRVLDFTDRNSCILFGDGAGAVLVEESDNNGLWHGVYGTDGTLGDNIYITDKPKSISGKDVVPDGYFHQNGHNVYKWALQVLSEQLVALPAKNGLEVDEIDCFIPHSANMRILESAFKTNRIPMDKCAESLTKYATTSSASIPLAWDRALKEGKISKGDILALFGFGGGLTYSGICLRNDIH